MLHMSYVWMLLWYGQSCVFQSSVRNSVLELHSSCISLSRVLEETRKKNTSVRKNLPCVEYSYTKIYPQISTNLGASLNVKSFLLASVKDLFGPKDSSDSNTMYNQLGFNYTR